MNDQLAVHTSRIATLTSVIRARREDAARREVHAGLPRDLVARAESMIVRLESVKAKLEAAIS